MLSSDIHCKENDWFRVVPVHPVIMVFMKSGSLFVESSMSCESWVYGYDPEFVIFLIMKIRALNTTSLKCCLPSTDAVDRRKKIHSCVWRFTVASCKHASFKSIRFYQKKKVSLSPLSFVKPTQMPVGSTLVHTHIRIHIK